MELFELKILLKLAIKKVPNQNQSVVTFFFWVRFCFLYFKKQCIMLSSQKTQNFAKTFMGNLKMDKKKMSIFEKWNKVLVKKEAFFFPTSCRKFLYNWLFYVGLHYINVLYFLIWCLKPYPLIIKKQVPYILYIFIP